MEPNNFEDKIKRQFQARKIEPSSQAWDRLDAMLSSSEVQVVQKSNYSWLRIVAMFLVFVSAGLWFFNTDNEEGIKINNNQIVVVSESKDVVKDSNKAMQPAQNNKENRLTHFVSSAEIRGKENGHNKEQRTDNYKIIKLDQNSEDDLQISKSEKLDVVNLENQIVLNETSKNQEINEEKFIKPKLKVDANALLQQVENEEKITFRQKVIKSIKKGYEEAKVAFVTRNQESSKNNQ